MRQERGLPGQITMIRSLDGNKGLTYKTRIKMIRRGAAATVR